MTQHTILDSLDPEIGEQLVTRRAAIIRGATLSAVAAAGLRMASVPLAIAGLARDAYGQGTLPSAVVTVLNFALTLEYLESEFYVRGVGTPGLIPAADQQIFNTIRAHEVEHVAFLESVLGSAKVARPTFDFTAGNGSNAGPYADVFTNYGTFIAVAQAFEDTGVRAYKGQAPALRPYDAFLSAALTIHSVEARHAAEVRRLRGTFSEMAPHKGWITGNVTDIPGTAATYAGEENTVQGGVNVTAFGSIDAASEAFDEPLTMAQVLSIVDPFIV